MIIRRKHIKKLGKNSEEELQEKSTHDSGPGYSESSSSYSYSSEKKFSKNKLIF